MAGKLKFSAERLIGSVRIIIANARQAGRNDVTIDLAPLEALADLAALAQEATKSGAE